MLIIIIIIIIIIYLFTAIGLSPGGSFYFTCKQNMKLATTVIPRLTKIIRSGITFVSGNLR